VSRQLAQLMGGDITVSSTETGASFTLWLTDGAVREVDALEGALAEASLPSSTTG